MTVFHAVYRGRIADQPICLTKLQYTDTRETFLAVTIMPGKGQGSHKKIVLFVPVGDL